MKSKASDDICTACSLSSSLPPLIWCIDCGEIVEVGEFDNETCRCQTCKEKHDKKLKSLQNKRAYEKRKNKIQ